MSETKPLEFDKSSWGDGPWQMESDRVDFEHAGLPCLLLRNRLGVWCGYAAVAPGHPLHGVHYGDVDIDVHGGLTYGSACDGHICHTPKPGEPDDVFWFGFDCAHGSDFAPYINAGYVQFGRKSPLFARHIGGTRYRNQFQTVEYRDVAYARTETERLAEQLAALAPRRDDEA